MGYHTLLTYRNLEELRKIEKEREVFKFMFGETQELIDERPNVCIDISALIYYLQANRNNIQVAYINFENITEDTVIIAEKTIAESALDLLPFLIIDTKDYYPEKSQISEQEISPRFKPYLRQKIYKYNNSEDLNQIIEYAANHNIPIVTFSQLNEKLKKEFEELNIFAEILLMDLTSVTYVIDDNKTLIYALEQLLHNLPNLKIIVQTKRIDVLLKYFPLFFDGQDSVRKLFPDLPDLGQEESEESKFMKITDLSNSLFDSFIREFNYNLIGHNNFKKRLRHDLRNFIFLNKVKEQRVFSIFLFGASGIGKTEVARLIASGLCKDSYFAKINFQNYSSQDALNSLIGSPAGYIGCDHGELSEKIRKSKVGVLLCDEFEKTNRPVFSFFLELLEEGYFTDSMAREYDLDGYIIIFTSNILNEVEYKKIIPPELQTRFDLVFEFEAPTTSEKLDFINLIFEKLQNKYSDQFEKVKMTEDEKKCCMNLIILLSRRLGTSREFLIIV